MVYLTNFDPRNALVVSVIQVKLIYETQRPLVFAISPHVHNVLSVIEFTSVEVAGIS